MTEKCRCHVRGDFEIVYCSLHAAAPELLERLKKHAEWLHEEQHRGSFTECGMGHCVFARKAIERAEGN